MKYNHYLAVMLAGSLAACGGGSGTTTSPTAETLASSIASSASSTAVLQKTTLAQGMVTGFGSVIVNGVHYDVKNADIDVDGDSHVESELGIGQMVRITGSVDADGIHGKATKLEGESQVRGAIETIDPAAGILVAVGQTIIINAETFYPEGVTAETLKVGDIIKVSAYTNADGELIATRVDLKTGSATDAAQVAGKIADLDTAALTFTINGKTVDYSKATVAEGVTLANDLLVRVRGSLVGDVLVASGTLQASPLSIKHDRDLGEHNDFAVGGLVSDPITSTSFKLNDATVLISADTVFEGGSAADLVAGLLVKVKGTLDADNNLVASNIKLILQPRVNENGLVQSLDLVLNTLTVNGVTFAVTVDTSFNDSGKDKVRLFSLSDLAVGNTINVHGYKVAATDTVPEHMVATRVERRFPSANSEHFQVEVHGLVESIVDSTLKVAGRSLTLNADTIIIGFDSLEAFLATALGSEIEVKGIIENGVFVATSVEAFVDDEGEHHSHSSRSDDGHSASSRSADTNPSSDESHSFSSRSAMSRSSTSESSRAVSSKSVSSKSAPAERSSASAQSFSSRSAMSRSSTAESSKSVSSKSVSSKAVSSKSAPAERSSASSRAPRSAPASSSEAASSASAG